MRVQVEERAPVSLFIAGMTMRVMMIELVKLPVSHRFRTNSGPFHSKDLRNATTQRISAFCVALVPRSTPKVCATQRKSTPVPPPWPRGSSMSFPARCLGSLVVRRERSFACATRAPRDTPALGDHGLRTALGCRCRGADCATLSSIVPTAAQVRGAGASEPDTNMVQALVGGRVPAAAGRRRGCSAETGVRALARWRAGVLGPAHVAGSRSHGIAAVVRCEPGLMDHARWLPPLSGFSRAASPPSRA